MRVTDSRTATARGSPVPLPDLSRATASLGWLIFVGCNAGSIRAVGAAELPPDTVDWLPIRGRRLLWPPCTPTSTSEPTRLAPPARSKQMKGTPEIAAAADGTLH